MSEHQASQVTPCIYTIETGKHEWNIMHSRYFGDGTHIGIDYCPQCQYVDLRRSLKRTNLKTRLKILFGVL